MDYQLELTNVAKHYKDFIAVDNVDLQIGTVIITYIIYSQ